jgi:hypothetical protein
MTRSFRKFEGQSFLSPISPGHRGGVYFEAGFAMGLGLPVFWTCRQDDLDKLHFDIRQYNCIDWADPPSLQTSITVVFTGEF